MQNISGWNVKQLNRTTPVLNIRNVPLARTNKSMDEPTAMQEQSQVDLPNGLGDVISQVGLPNGLWNVIR